MRIELANAQRRGEFQRAGELAYGRIPELEKKLAEIEAKENPGEMMEEAVTANHMPWAAPTLRHRGAIVWLR